MTLLGKACCSMTASFIGWHENTARGTPTGIAPWGGPGGAAPTGSPTPSPSAILPLPTPVATLQPSHRLVRGHEEHDCEADEPENRNEGHGATVAVGAPEAPPGDWVALDEAVEHVRKGKGVGAGWDDSIVGPDADRPSRARLAVGTATREHSSVMDEYDRYDPGMTAYERFRRRHERTFRRVKRFVRGPLVAAIVGAPLLWMAWTALGASSGHVSLPATAGRTSRQIATSRERTAVTIPTADLPPRTTPSPAVTLLAPPTVSTAAVATRVSAYTRPRRRRPVRRHR